MRVCVCVCLRSEVCVCVCVWCACDQGMFVPPLKHQVGRERFLLSKLHVGFIHFSSN